MEARLKSRRRNGWWQIEMANLNIFWSSEPEGGKLAMIGWNLKKFVSELPAAVSLTHTQAFSYFPFYHTKNNHITHSINSSLLEQILGHF